MQSEWNAQVRQGQRFAFGENWNRFLLQLTDAHIVAAGDSLKGLLGLADLTGMRFLDAGSGSGLFSLAARQLGAHVVSFDYDPQSVACTRHLRERYSANDPDWAVHEGSALDPAFLGGLGDFDIVYSWGVLHHTGHMWDAVDALSHSVGPGGLYALALYNTQPVFTPVWKGIKRIYCGAPAPGKFAIAGAWAVLCAARGLAADLLRLRNPLMRYRASATLRGMSFWRDVVDWVGGHPFETATPDEVVQFLNVRGFARVALRTVGRRLGCNEFVFRREEKP